MQDIASPLTGYLARKFDKPWAERSRVVFATSEATTHRDNDDAAAVLSRQLLIAGARRVAPAQHQPAQK